jgi:ADP-L-glycero-D-manno-heptose 6-epimerase
VIVITGGAGFIGSNLVAALNESGCRDIAVCDLFGTNGKWQNLRKRFLSDLVAPAALFEWLGRRTDIETIVHLGAITSTYANDGDDVVERNFRFSVRLLDWCTARQVPLIYASSAATYGDGERGFDDSGSFEHLRRLRPLNLYGWSKHLFDQLVADRIERGHRLPPQCVGLKFFNVFGPNEYHKGEMMSVPAKLFAPIRRGEEVQLFRSYRADYADGEQLRDFVYVADVVDAMLWLMRRGTGRGLFNLGTGKARSFVDLVAAMFSSLGLECRIRFIDMPEELRPSYQYYTQADLTRLRREGYDRPFSELEVAVADFVLRYLDTADAYR